MRLTTHQDASSAHLLKVLLDALSNRSGSAGGRGQPLLEEKMGASPPARAPIPMPAPPTRTPPDSPLGFNRPAPGAADAVAAQMLGTLMTEGEALFRAPAEIGAAGERRDDRERSDLKLEERDVAQPKAGAATGPIPWPAAALAAYSVRPTELSGLQPEVRRARLGEGGRSAPASAWFTPLQRIRKALAYTFVIVVVFVLLNRDALFG